MFYSVYFCSLLSDPNASTPTRTPSSLSQVPPPSPMTTPKSVKSSSSKKLSLSRSFSTVQMPPSGGGGFGGMSSHNSSASIGSVVVACSPYNGPMKRGTNRGSTLRSTPYK